MIRWAIGGTALLVAAAGVMWVSGSRSGGPEVVVNAPAVPEPAPPAPPRPTPAVLARVVDVTDIDPLLDPPAIPVTADVPAGPVLTSVGFEEPVAAPAVGGEVLPIPPAAGDDAVEVAPMPREVRAPE